MNLLKLLCPLEAGHWDLKLLFCVFDPFYIGARPSPIVDKSKCLSIRFNVKFKYE